MKLKKTVFLSITIWESYRGGKLRFAIATEGCIILLQTAFDLSNRNSAARKNWDGKLRFAIATEGCIILLQTAFELSNRNSAARLHLNKFRIEIAIIPLITFINQTCFDRIIQRVVNYVTITLTISYNPIKIIVIPNLPFSF